MLTLQEVLLAVNGSCNVDKEIKFTGFTTDSRSVKEGELFVALKGEKFDGHAYCAKAVASGAAGVLVEAEVTDLPDDAVVIKVEDTLVAFQQIARLYREKHKNLKVVAITGSNGKTSTKDLIAACLSVKYNIIKTQGNFNNEIGLPKTLLSICEDTEIAVVEMGMRGLGQIASLCALATPDVGVITNVGATHIEVLGSIENIALAKSEIVSSLKPGGTAILNADNEYVRNVKAPEGVSTVAFGIDGEADIKAFDVVSDASGSRFKVCDMRTGEEADFAIPLIGKHNVENALAAIAVAGLFGVKLIECAEALKAPQMTGKRQELLRFGDITVINDAYNASPASMTSALKTLHSVKKAGNGRAVAVLADMLELGEYSEHAHREMGLLAAEEQVDVVITYGGAARYIAQAAEERGVKAYACADRAEAADVLKGLLQKDDIVLLKGSHSMQVDGIIDLVFKE